MKNKAKKFVFFKHEGSDRGMAIGPVSIEFGNFDSFNSKTVRDFGWRTLRFAQNLARRERLPLEEF